MNSDKQQATCEAFIFYVNMTADELKEWLSTNTAKSVGWVPEAGPKHSPEGEKSEGYKSGEHILNILRTPKHKLCAADFEHMQRVVSYIKRHLAQRPNKDITNTRWRYSLMNWGHDPLK